MRNRRKYLGLLDPRHYLHVATGVEVVRHFKVVVDTLFQDHRRERPELLSLLDFVDPVFDVWASRVGQQTTIPQRSRAPFSTSASHTNDTMGNEMIKNIANRIITRDIVAKKSVTPT
jgi:hypothetical protein